MRASAGWKNTLQGIQPNLQMYMSRQKFSRNQYKTFILKTHIVIRAETFNQPLTLGNQDSIFQNVLTLKHVTYLTND